MPEVWTRILLIILSILDRVCFDFDVFVDVVCGFAYLVFLFNLLAR